MLYIVEICEQCNGIEMQNISKKYHNVRKSTHNSSKIIEKQPNSV